MVWELFLLGIEPRISPSASENPSSPPFPNLPNPHSSHPIYCVYGRVYGVSRTTGAPAALGGGTRLRVTHSGRRFRRFLTRAYA